MDIFKITAILGALAWLPQIGKWIIDWFQKPKLKIFGDNDVQIGFISFGSVLNINMSFLSVKKNALIENVELTITDKDNGRYNLSWMWYGETFYELKASAELATMTMGKQQKAIAFLAYKDVLAEKLIGFQSKAFLEQRKLLVDQLNQYIENQKYAGEIDMEAVKKSNEYIDLMKLYDESFIWEKVSMRQKLQSLYLELKLHLNTTLASH